MPRTLFDSSILANTQDSLDFITSVLQSSTEYSIIGKAMDGTIVLWNEGARRLYGYQPDEVVGKVNADILHTPEDVATGKPKDIREAAFRDGSWQGVIERVRKDGRRFMANVVMTPRLYLSGEQLGFLVISKDVANDVRFTEKELFRSHDALLRFTRASSGRELRIIQVKQQVNQLSARLGEPPPYPLAFMDAKATEIVRTTPQAALAHFSKDPKPSST